MNGSQPAKNLDASGSERKPEQTVKNVRGKGNANANKERKKVWTARGITNFTSCNSNDTNSSNLADLHPHNNTTPTTTTITSFIITIQCPHLRHPRIITIRRGTLTTEPLVLGEWRETWNTVDRGQIHHYPRRLLTSTLLPGPISALWSTSHLSFPPVVTNERGRGSVNAKGNENERSTNKIPVCPR